MATGMKIIKPTHRSVKAYYETLKGYAGQDVSHETAVRSAFQNLLADAAKLHGWTLIPELSHPGKTGAIRPDGTIRDGNYLPRGYWEAKDTSDDLDAEIRKKIAKNYPLTNTIFEDTRTAVLYQDKQEVRRINLSDADALAQLLNDFFAHSEPDIEQFEHAVTEFKERVPELALGLAEKIRDAHKNNPRFIAAFGEFFTLCQTSLNPNISVAAVDEMLVQHLLTERLFRTIFDNEEFTQRNVIAAEVEKVITALVSKSFNRREFLKSLDRFYVAIEDAARSLQDFTEKQHFLNTVYERFFQGYSVKVADTHGIVYTPQPIVDFMCASVAELLEKEFGKPLGSRDVHILDPCTGTGNFIVNLLRRIPKRNLPRMYREQLFANEVMLLPYYIAALNIEHAYYALTGEYEPFEGLCFLDTLDMAEHAQGEFGFMTEENTARIQRQKDAPITVVIGNPPYNVGQLNENDNNKNRKYEVVDKRIRETYAADSKATNKNALSDMYVKFFRWAIDRLDGRDGIVCFVSNNSFVDQIAFDGMRKHLAQEFTAIYHVDLHGNVRKNPKLSGTTHNVFGIQVGVGITVAVRNAAHPDHAICYHRVPEDWRKEEKLAWLADRASICGLRNAGILPASKAGEDACVTDECRHHPIPEAGHTRRSTGILPAPKAGEDACVTVKGRGYLPHWYKEDAETSYYVTFRLGDSLPATLLAEIEAERERLLKHALEQDKPMSRADRDQMEHVFSERIEQFLDAGAGACHLAKPSVTAMMRDVLFHFNGERYDIHAWAIMPNHVHLLLNCRPGWDLSTNLQSMKSFSSKQANMLLHRTGKFWQRESYDHIVRSQDEYDRILKYIVENPARAGLTDWPWAGFNPDILPGDPESADIRNAGILPACRAGEDVPNAGILPAPHAGEDACVTGDCWHHLVPDAGCTWLVPEHADLFTSFIPVGTKSAKADDAVDVHTIFKIFSGGVKTNRDEVVYDFDREALVARVREFIENYNAEVDRWRRAPVHEDVDNFVRYERIKWSRDLKLDLRRGNYAEFSDSKVRQGLYRPFVREWLFFDRLLNEEVYVMPRIFPTLDSERENRLIWLKVGSEWPTFVLLVQQIPDLLPQGGSQCFPFYIYDEDGSNRRENITDWALAQFKAKYGERKVRGGASGAVTQASSPAGDAGKMPALPGASAGGEAGRMPALHGHSGIEKWDIFYYVYGLLHHPGYRAKYADNLRRELPRISSAPDFWAFSKAGRDLAQWHLDYEEVQPYPLTFEVAKDRPLSYRVDDKMRLSKDRTSVTVNPSLTLSGIPAEAFEYRLGNRSALDWVIDQYQVKHDAKGEVTSDPNRADDPEYIVRLVGQVIRVSLETVRIVNALPQDFGG